MDGVHHMMDGVHHMMDTFFLTNSLTISLVFNSPRIKEFEFNGCYETFFSISHYYIAELYMLSHLDDLGSII